MNLLRAHVQILVVLLCYITFKLSSGEIPEFTSFEFTRIPSNSVVTLGSSVVLPCSAKYNGNAVSTYSWEHNGDLLSLRTDQSSQNRVIYQNGSLVITSVSDKTSSPDVGNYRCIAEVVQNEEFRRITSPTASLQPAKLLSVVLQPRSVRVTVGESVMFECQSDSLPAARYSWTKDGRPIQMTDKTISHGHGENLEITDVTLNDAGLYKCTAENQVGRVESETGLLTVTDSQDSNGKTPEFSVRPHDVTPVQGAAVTLYCSIYGRGGDGRRSKITWLRQGSTIDIKNSNGHYQLLGSGSLRIYNVTEQDNGVFTCRGENSNDVADAEATVMVHVPPYFVRQLKDTYSHVNEDVELTCDIRGVPEPKVTWYKDSDVIRNSPYFNRVGNTLRIMGLMKSDSGYFQCVGENSEGRVYSTSQLIVLDEDVRIAPHLISSLSLNNSTAIPQAPSGLQAAIVSYTYVSLKWNSSHTAEKPVTGYTISTVTLDQQANSRVRSANTTSTDYTIQGLQPNTEYIFQVYAYNRNGRSANHKELRVRTTAEAAVSSPVRNLQVIVQSQQSMSVTWDVPSRTNGDITQYKVFYYSHDQGTEKHISVSTQSVEINDLDPYTFYHVRVVAINSNGEGSPTEEITVRTFSAKPSEAPKNVTAEATGTTSVVVRWVPPSPRSINGQLTGYKIRYKAKLSFGRAYVATTDADAMSQEILDLESGTDYIFRVGAMNINGTGELSPWFEVKTSDTEFDETRPPSSPLYIRADPLARQIIVSWSPADDGVLIRGFKLGYGTIFPEESWKSIDANQRIYTLTDLKPQTNYVMQLIAFNRQGESAPVLQQTFTKEDTVVDPDPQLMPPLAVVAEVLSSTTVIVRWYDNTLGSNQKVTDDRYYTVRYNALSGSAHRKTRYVNSTALVAEIDDLKPYTKYEFAVMITKGRRTSVYSLTARNITLEDAPESAPEDLTASQSNKGTDYLTLSWQPPARPNGRLVTYKIYSNTDPNQPLNKWIIDSVPGHQLNHEFGPVTPLTDYYFRILVTNNIGSSPLSETLSVKTPNVDGTGGRGLDSLSSATKIPSFSIDGLTSVVDNSDVVNPYVTLPTTTRDSAVEQAPADTDQSTSLLNSPYLLWIIIACVAFAAVVAIAAIVIVICRKKSKQKNRDAVNQQASSPKPQPPDLWIDHEQHGLNAMSSTKSDTDDPDEMTSMLQSNFDVSVSMAGDVPYRDDRYPSVGRRPVIIAPQNHREGMPRAAVPPMSNESARPLYPRTQFASGVQYGSTPRVHVGDTSQPSSEYYQQHQASMSQLHRNAGGVPSSPSHDSRSNALRSFNIPPAPPTNALRQYVKPQPSGAYNAMTGSSYQTSSPTHQPSPSMVNSGSPSHTNSMRRPPRNAVDGAAINSNELSAGREQLKTSMMTKSTEQLSEEMANLDCIMQDLNAIKNDFEMT